MRIFSRPEKETPEELHKILKPNHIINRPDYIKVNDKYNKVLSAVGYPRVVDLGFLDRIIKAKGDFDISIHINPSSLDSIRFKLNKLLTKQKADLISSEKRGVDIPSLSIQHEDTLNLLRQVERGEEKVFDISLYINAKGNNTEEMTLLTNKVKAELNGIGIITKEPTFRMKEGLQSVLPLAADRLRAMRTLTTSALAECFPFTSTYLNIERNGIIFGINKVTGVPIIKDVFSSINSNMLIIGTSGSGKSYFAKMFLSRHVMRGTKVMIIDPNAEYKNIVKKLGGSEVKISKDSETMINIFDLMGFPFDEKKLSLISAFSIMLGELTFPQKSVLDDAVEITYSRKGISNDPSTWKKRPPILEDLYNVLMEMKNENREVQKSAILDSLLLRLKSFVYGTFSFMNRETLLNIEANPINFNIKEMPEIIRPAVSYLILNYIYSKMNRDPNPKMLVVDEAWDLLSKAEEAPFLFKMIKTSRKFYLSMVLIVQEILDLLSTRAGNSILANTSCKFLFRQDPAVIDDIVQKLKLNANEKNILLMCGKGEGLLIADTEHIPMKIIASKAEDELITTAPKEFLKNEKEIEKPVKKRKLSDEEFDIKKGLFEEKELAQEQINALMSVGYEKIRQAKFAKGRGEWYYIKRRLPKENESIKHLFLVKVVEEEARRYTNEVKLYETRKPDIVFLDKNGNEIAAEVETGTTILKKDKIEEKVNLLKKDFGKNFFFVVTDRKFKKKYKKFGETITRIDIPKKIRSYF